jgi:hypothetical protein
MRRMAVLRLSLPGSASGVTREDFWTGYWQINRLGPDFRDVAQSHDQIDRKFGPLLAEKLSSLGNGWEVEVEVRAIRYGSIELLLSLVGGEELLSEMFWTVLEFYAPEAFNEAVTGNVPLRAGVTHGRGGGHGGAGHGGNRVLALASAPVILLILGAVVTVGLLIWKIESLEHEYVELHHDYTHIVGRITQQNGALVRSLTSKLGIVATPENDEHKHEEKAVTPAHPATATPAPASPPGPFPPAVLTPPAAPPSNMPSAADKSLELKPSAAPSAAPAAPKAEPSNEKKSEN